MLMMRARQTLKGAIWCAHVEQVFQHGQRKRECFAGAGSRAADEVASGARWLEDVFLDGEQRLDVALVQGHHRLV